MTFEEIKQSFNHVDDDPTKNRQYLNKKNFGMPAGRFLKTKKKSREFRNKSRSRSKEITMYVGAIDDPNEVKEPK